MWKPIDRLQLYSSCGGEQQLRVWLWGCGWCQNWDNDKTPAEGIHINTGNRSGAWAATAAAGSVASYGISSSSRPCRSYLQLSSTHRCGEKAGPLCKCKCRSANGTGTGSAFSPRYVNNCANPSIWLDVENFINFYWALLFDIWVINDVAIDIVVGTFRFNFITLLLTITKSDCWK